MCYRHHLNNHHCRSRAEQNYRPIQLPWNCLTTISSWIIKPSNIYIEHSFNIVSATLIFTIPKVIPCVLCHNTFLRVNKQRFRKWSDYTQLRRVKLHHWPGTLDLKPCALLNTAHGSIITAIPQCVIEVITLNVKDLNLLIKDEDCQIGLKIKWNKKAKPNYLLFIMD